MNMSSTLSPSSKHVLDLIKVSPQSDTTNSAHCALNADGCTTSAPAPSSSARNHRPRTRTRRTAADKGTRTTVGTRHRVTARQHKTSLKDFALPVHYVVPPYGEAVCEIIPVRAYYQHHQCTAYVVYLQFLYSEKIMLELIVHDDYVNFALALYRMIQRCQAVPEVIYCGSRLSMLASTKVVRNRNRCRRTCHQLPGLLPTTAQKAAVASSEDIAMPPVPLPGNSLPAMRATGAKATAVADAVADAAAVGAAADAAGESTTRNINEPNPLTTSFGHLQQVLNTTFFLLTSELKAHLLSRMVNNGIFTAAEDSLKALRLMSPERISSYLQHCECKFTTETELPHQSPLQNQSRCKSQFQTRSSARQTGKQAVLPSFLVANSCPLHALKQLKEFRKELNAFNEELINTDTEQFVTDFSLEHKFAGARQQLARWEYRLNQTEPRFSHGYKASRAHWYQKELLYLKPAPLSKMYQNPPFEDLNFVTTTWSSADLPVSKIEYDGSTYLIPCAPKTRISLRHDQPLSFSFNNPHCRTWHQQTLRSPFPVSHSMLSRNPLCSYLLPAPAQAAVPDAPTVPSSEESEQRAQREPGTQREHPGRAHSYATPGNISDRAVTSSLISPGIVADTASDTATRGALPEYRERIFYLAPNIRGVISADYANQAGMLVNSHLKLDGHTIICNDLPQYVTLKQLQQRWQHASC